MAGVRGAVLVLRAEGVAVVVGRDLAEHVGEVRGEVGDTVFGTDLVRTVDGDAVVEDADPDRPQGQRERLHAHRDGCGLATAYREMFTVDLVPVRGDRDQVLAVGQAA